MEPTIERAPNFLPRVDENALTQVEVDGRVVSLTAPASMAAEQYRNLYYRLERMRSLRPMRVVSFTSALPGEGKTVTAVNLAMAAARATPDRRILLIDADLRRSQVAELLGVRARPGLADVLAGDCELGEAVRYFQSTRLALICAGTAPEEPTTLLAGGRMQRLLSEAREAFDEIYIDLPPTLPFADAGILGPQSDAVILVIRANSTSIDRVTDALEHLAGSPVIGSVLNGAERSAETYFKAYDKPARR